MFIVTLDQYSAIITLKISELHFILPISEFVFSWGKEFESNVLCNMFYLYSAQHFFLMHSRDE